MNIFCKHKLYAYMSCLPDFDWGGGGVVNKVSDTMCTHLNSRYIRNLNFEAAEF